MQLPELVSYLQALMQPELVRDYCPNGLQVAGRSNIQKIVTGVSANQALLDASITANADAILVHHGYFWKGEVQTLTGMKKKRLATLLKNDVSLFAYHLPLDTHAELGNNVQLAQRLGIDITGTHEVDGVRGLFFEGRLQTPSTSEHFATHIQNILSRAPLHIPGSDKPIETLAWCTGGAQRYIEKAVELGVDAYITGEASEQTVHVAREMGLHFYAAGHHATERYGVQALGKHLADKFSIEHEFIDIDNPV